MVCQLHHMTRKKFNNNLEDVLSFATPDHWKKGKTWYPQVSMAANEIAMKTSADFDKVCQVISALSPASRWERNIIDAEKLVTAYQANESIDSFQVTTYGANKIKAWSIMEDKLSLSLDTGFKTYNFYKNIYRPLDPTYVTIDRHAAKILEGERDGGSVAMTKKQYLKYAQYYKDKAKELGLVPNQLQAITWEAYKSMVQR